MTEVVKEDLTGERRTDKLANVGIQIISVFIVKSNSMEEISLWFVQIPINFSYELKCNLKLYLKILLLLYT